MDDLVPKGHPEDDMFYRGDFICPWDLGFDWIFDIGNWKFGFSNYLGFRI
jgi:hypothetical protein